MKNALDIRFVPKLLIEDILKFSVGIPCETLYQIEIPNKYHNLSSHLVAQKYDNTFEGTRKRLGVPNQNSGLTREN